ncbi:MAG: hypothetical protein ABSG91_05955 [Syntrophobacteraceae bacterium]|jgi:hypothetical protein
MKKVASIIGIGVISMAVAIAPVFAQQTKPQEPAGSAAIQPKSDVKIPVVNQTGKDEKNLTAKPGSDVKSEVVPGKAVPDVKAGAAPAKTDTGAKDRKGSTAKPGANLKSGQTAKPHADAKAVATPKHHVKKSSGNPASRMHAKARVSSPNTPKTDGKNAAEASSTGK